MSFRGRTSTKMGSVSDWTTKSTDGGRARESTRYPTKRIPKPLLRIGDKPILEMILDSLISQGFYRFNLVVNYRAELIERYFGNGHQWGADFQQAHADSEEHWLLDDDQEEDPR